MNFFEHQENARRTSRRLIVLFVLAVIAIVIAVNLIALLIYSTFVSPVRGGGLVASLPHGFFAVNTAITVLLIGGGTWWETQRLSAGGEAVANMVHARRVDPATRDLLERRLINVVEEMALASGTPVPRVYVMDNETSINAFAAGHSLHDAVIAVTRGTLTRLNRDELQGVIGHEFSHILNGDMQLNIRLIGVLFGLLMLALFGRFMMEIGRGSRSDRRGASVFFLAGIALWIIGYIGVFFGRMIKAGVSRSREYLADASAVQFTRNRDGIGGALRKIGGLSTAGGLGTRINHPHAELLSHLFLGAALPSLVSGWLATHPPLAQRIQRIYGRSMPLLSAPEQPLAVAWAASTAPAPAAGEAAAAVVSGSAFVEPAQAAPAGASADASPVGALFEATPAAAQLPEAIGHPQVDGSALARRIERLPGEAALESALADSVEAQWVVCALLIEKDRSTSGQQRQLVAEAFGTQAAQQIDRFHDIVAALPPGVRLPLLDRAAPALSKLAQAQRDRLLLLAHALIVADGRITLHEFLLFTVLKQRCDADAHRPVRVKYSDLRPLEPEVALVLSLIAGARMPDRPLHAYNAGVLLLQDFDAPLQPVDAIALESVGRALKRLNHLAPLAKPRLIKALAATAFVDGTTTWKAASCLRTVCAALDSPLPPQLRVSADVGDARVAAPQTTVGQPNRAEIS